MCVAVQTWQMWCARPIHMSHSVSLWKFWHSWLIHLETDHKVLLRNAGLLSAPRSHSPLKLWVLKAASGSLVDESSTPRRVENDWNLTQLLHLWVLRLVTALIHNCNTFLVSFALKRTYSDLSVDKQVACTSPATPISEDIALYMELCTICGLYRTQLEWTFG